MNIYELLDLCSLAIATTVYYFYFYTHYNTKEVVKDNMSHTEFTRLALLLVFLAIPQISYFYIKTTNYSTPEITKQLGVVLIIIGVVCFIRTSYDLGDEFSYTLQIKEDHKLVDSGIFGYIRHPMYFCLLLLLIIQMLLIPNVIGIVTNIFLIYIFWAGRIPDEEAMMIKEFGDRYRSYMQRTHSVIPFIL